MKPVVQGIAKTAPQANAVVEELRARGFVDPEIAVLFPDRQEADVTGAVEGTKAPEAAAAVGMAGLGVGGALGLLAGVGALVIPGIGPLVVVGPLMAALSAARARATRASLQRSYTHDSSWQSGQDTDLRAQRRS